MGTFGRLLGRLSLRSKRQEEACCPDGKRFAFDEIIQPDGSVIIQLADIEQTIARVRQLRRDDIDEMVDRKHDLDYQLTLCQSMMRSGDILPFAFERAVVLLRKANRLEEELKLCRYVERWCREAKRGWDGSSAMHWRSPKLQKCVGRIPEVEALIASSGERMPDADGRDPLSSPDQG